MSETGRLMEDYSVVCEAAERVATSGAAAVEGLDVAQTGEGSYEIRQGGLLVFRCRRGRPPLVFTPGEWVVRLVRAGREAAASTEHPSKG